MFPNRWLEQRRFFFLLIIITSLQQTLLCILFKVNVPRYWVCAELRTTIVWFLFCNPNPTVRDMARYLKYLVWPQKYIGG